MPSRSITRLDQTSSTEVFLPISKLPKVPFSSSLYQIAKPLLSHISSLILSLLLLMKMKTSPLIRSCGTYFLTSPDRPLKPSEGKRNYAWRPMLINKRLKSSILMLFKPILIPLGRVIDKPETWAGFIIWRNWGAMESVSTGESSILKRLFQW